MAVNEKSIRASALSSYNDCSRRSAAQMFPLAISDAGFTLAPTRTNVGAAIGTGAHAALEYTLRHKMEHGSQGHDDEAEARGIDAFRKDIVDGVHYDHKVASNANQAESQVIRTSRLLRAAVTPKINPVAVEVEFKATYRGFDVTGHIDVQEATEMGDLKTGKFERMNAPQYGTYVMLGRTAGHEVRQFKEYYLRTVPLDKASPAPVTHLYDVDNARDQAVMRLDYIINDYTAFLESGNPASFRANPASLLCDAKYCAAWGTKFCKEHKGA